MTSTADKIAKLTNSTTTASQLIWPSGYDSDLTNNPGMVLLFEISRIEGERLTNEKASGSSTKKTIKGSYGTEAAIQGQAGAASLRNKAVDSVTTAGGTSGVYKKTNQSIVLPMPAITTSDSAQWVNTDLADIARVQDFGSTIFGDDWKTIETVAKDTGLRVGAGALEKLSGTKVMDFLSLRSGALANPYSEVLFKGMNNRILPLTFKMVPKSAAEAKSIQAIIHRFRFHMRPSMKYASSASGNSSYLIAPSVFDISAIDLSTGSQITWFPKFSSLALQTCDVNYAPEGTPSFMTDKGIGAVTMTLNFEELSIVMQENMSDPSNSY